MGSFQPVEIHSTGLLISGKREEMSASFEMPFLELIHQSAPDVVNRELNVGGGIEQHRDVGYGIEGIGICSFKDRRDGGDSLCCGGDCTAGAPGPPAVGEMLQQLN